MRFGLVRSSAIGVCLLASAPAFAGQAECDLIAKSMLAVADQPAVRQTVDLGAGKGEGMSSILLKDAIYVREEPNAAWRKMPFTAAMRKTMAEKALVSLPLSDCAEGSADAANGVAVKSYGFKQPDPLKPGSKSSSSILIAPSDGLPRRMDLTDGSAMVFEYGDFKAPTP
ncbi:hypothetical protein [Methylopila sp. M107]|uniref:hypothetical protein n=1 Tax=Methylopila sp. M107 TaxID=1101190 RepID=UPI00036065C6|nr:hypothetical protein [Methylopila sp. M107]